MIKFIKCTENVNPDDFQRALEGSGLKVLKRYALTGIFKVEVPDTMRTMTLSKQSIQSMVKGLTVTEVYDDFPVKALLNNAIPKTRVDLVWNRRGNEGEGMIIGICDTGVDAQHGDLAGRVLGTSDFTGEGDFDGNGHGTHVATISAGNGALSNGRYRGAAPKAKLYMAKGLNSQGQGSASSIADGIEWLYEQKVHVISLSLGGEAQPGVRDILQVTCEAAVDKGIPVFCAAGNSGPAERTIATPGVSLKVITVGASDDRDQVASFSSRGPTADGFEKPDIVAPGVAIIAGRARNTAMGTVIDDHYVEASGTSMATPLAAGIGALILKEHNGITPDDLKARLETYALDLRTGNDNIEGEGRVDAFAAITGTQPPRIPDIPIEPPQSSCLLSRLFGSNQTLLAVFRRMRDHVLAPIPGGRQIILNYYRISRLLLWGA